MTLVLASASPRRRDLLRAAGVDCRCRPTDVDETVRAGEPPAAYALRLAREKASRVASECPQDIVLGADTVVAFQGVIYGKPRDVADARRMLTVFSGREHMVYTAVCLLRRTPGWEQAWVSESAVRFRKLSPCRIDAYLSLIDPLDKAGAYAIQDHGDDVVAAVRGLTSTVIGLPVEEVLERLGRAPDL